jgi:diguanylate cyclase (GGDEF)-like protein
MEPIPLLVVESEDTFFSRLKSLVDSKEFLIERVNTLEDAQQILDQRLQNLGILFVLPEKDECQEICKQLRKRYFQEPLQIIKASESMESTLLEEGIDDVLHLPISDLELRVRVQAAGIRCRKQMRLVEEREYYRQAVKQEEELASKILDQNLKLKRAFEHIEQVNEELVQANRELERIAKHDHLSGLLNRISLFSSVDAEIERALRSGTPLSGIMIDIDHFKNINDNYGHQCGDDVIRMIGKWLLGNLRKYDLAGRYGGEEFFVVLPNTRLSHAVKIAERFRKTIQDYGLSCNDALIRITASMGVAEYRMGETRDMWINRADQAMYVAKNRGRNQVVADTFPIRPKKRSSF